MENKEYTLRLEEQVAALEAKLEVNDKELEKFVDLDSMSCGIISCIVAELNIKLCSIQGQKSHQERCENNYTKIIKKLGSDAPEAKESRILIINIEDEIDGTKESILDIFRAISSVHNSRQSYEQALNSMLNIIKSKKGLFWDMCGCGDSDTLERIMPWLKEIIDDNTTDD